MLDTRRPRFRRRARSSYIPSSRHSTATGPLPTLLFSLSRPDRLLLWKESRSLLFTVLSLLSSSHSSPTLFSDPLLPPLPTRRSRPFLSSCAPSSSRSSSPPSSVPSSPNARTAVVAISVDLKPTAAARVSTPMPTLVRRQRSSPPAATTTFS